jgi:hypothetical protein
MPKDTRSTEFAGGIEFDMSVGLWNAQTLSNARSKPYESKAISERRREDEKRTLSRPFWQVRRDVPCYDLDSIMFSFDC